MIRRCNELLLSRKDIQTKLSHFDITKGRAANCNAASVTPHWQTCAAGATRVDTFWLAN
jgi:hypothetical protein